MLTSFVCEIYSHELGVGIGCLIMVVVWVGCKTPLLKWARPFVNSFIFGWEGENLKIFLGSPHVFAITFPIKFLIVCPMCHQCFTLFSSIYFAKCSYVVSAIPM